jgi:hypothetical protein
VALIPFDRLYGQDAFGYFDYAAALARRSARQRRRRSLAAGLPLRDGVGGAAGHTPVGRATGEHLAGALVAPLTLLARGRGRTRAGARRA